MSEAVLPVFDEEYGVKYAKEKPGQQTLNPAFVLHGVTEQLLLSRSDWER